MANRQKLNRDMTYCSNDKCGYLRCRSNPKHIKHLSIPHSVADLDGTDSCYKIAKNTGVRRVKQQLD